VLRIIHFLVIGIGSFLCAYSQDQSTKNDPGYLIHSIYFGGGSYYIDEQQQKEVFEFIRSIPGLERYQISVHAHTDNIGSIEYNQWLAAMRSEAAILLLERYSVEREMIEIKRFGKYNPIYDNDTWIGRLKNRRVDIILWPIVF
jgi:outer membrane protein OmpA-like peptidoglycan-associated protein